MLYQNNQDQKTTFEIRLQNQCKVFDREFYVVALYDKDDNFEMFLSCDFGPNWRGALKWKTAEKAHDYMLRQRARYDGSWQKLHDNIFNYSVTYANIDFSKYKVVKICQKITVEETE